LQKENELYMCHKRVPPYEVGLDWLSVVNADGKQNVSLLNGKGDCSIERTPRKTSPRISLNLCNARAASEAESVSKVITFGAGVR